MFRSFLFCQGICTLSMNSMTFVLIKTRLFHCKLYMSNSWQTRITLHLANIKWITGLIAPQLSSLTLAVFGPNTYYNYNNASRFSIQTTLLSPQIFLPSTMPVVRGLFGLGTTAVSSTASSSTMLPSSLRARLLRLCSLAWEASAKDTILLGFSLWYYAK